MTPALAEPLRQTLSEAIHQAYDGPVKIDILPSDVPRAVEYILAETEGFCPHIMYEKQELYLIVHEIAEHGKT